MLEIEKLTSMGKMAAGTAHHLNSPLAALLLRVQLMRENPGATEFSEDLVRLEDGLKFCRHFVQRLLEFTRTNPVQKENLDLEATVKSVAGFFMPVIRSRQVLLSIDTSAARGQYVYADRNLLETLLLILLSNALDAVTAGGEIKMACGLVTPGEVELSVSDNGCGIRPADLQRVFEPFFTTKEPGKGTGLGLAIAKNLASEHSGSIRLESEVGVGTIAYVDLPLVSAVVPAPEMIS
jgi:signal transduction histidine kinase